MNIAVCHLAFSMNTLADNLHKLCRAADMAGRCGADWLVTPEMALQGYYFSKNSAGIQPQMLKKNSYENVLDPLLDRIRRYGMTLFLGTGEKDEKGQLFNSFWVLNRQGVLAAEHRKTVVPRGGAEDWACPGMVTEPVSVDGISAGILVCADAWKAELGITLARQGAEFVIDGAAWAFSPCCPDPVGVWKTFSRRSGLPLLVANQTGQTPWMDMRPAMSALLDRGELCDSYAGGEALLTACWDREHHTWTGGFRVIPFADTADS